MNRRGRENRPGLSEIAYGIGTQPEILARMVEELSTMELGEHGQRPLAALTTRAGDEPAMAFLDAWAAVLDVLGFYQERIANEGYLRTALQRRSILEQARSIGYELKPGTAATVYLSFIAEDGPGAPDLVPVPRGTKVMSLPGQNELPRTFETSEDFTAKAEWNVLKPNLRAKHEIGPGAVMAYLAGPAVRLIAGDVISILGPTGADENREHEEVRVLTKVEIRPEENHTLVHWNEPLVGIRGEPIRIFAYRGRANLFGYNAPNWNDIPDEVKGEARIRPRVTALFMGNTDILTGSDAGALRLWRRDGNTIEHVRVLFEQDAPITALASGVAVRAAGYDDGLVRLFDPEGALIREVRLAAPVTILEFSPSGDSLLMGAGDGSLETRMVSNPESPGTTADTSDAQPTAARLFADERLMYGDAAGRIHIRDMRADIAPLEVQAHDAAVAVLDVILFERAGESPRTFVLSGDENGTAKISEVSEGPDPDNPGATRFFLTEKQVINLPGGAPAKLVFHPVPELTEDMPSRFLAGSAAGSLFEWRLRSDGSAVWHEFQPFPGHGAPVLDAVYSPDGAFALSAGGEGRVIAWDTETRNSVASFSPPMDDEALPADWPGILMSGHELFMDGPDAGFIPGTRVLLADAKGARSMKILEATRIIRNDFLLSEKVNRLKVQGDESIQYDPRETRVYIRSEELQIATRPVHRREPIQGRMLEIDHPVTGLESDKALILKGRPSRLRIRRANPPVKLLPEDGSPGFNLMANELVTLLEVPGETEDGMREWRVRTRTGVIGRVKRPAEEEGVMEFVSADPDEAEVSELMVLKNLHVGTEFSTLEFQKAPRHSYDRETAEVNANIVSATHGDTVEEILGSGDASMANQSFVLRRPPLTHVSAPTPGGMESSLRVRVNGVLWKQVDSIHNLDSRERGYMVRIEDDGTTRVVFGDGENGERPATGRENIAAEYRIGLGREGRVGAGSVRLLRTRPLGIRDVVNPLPAEGGADPEQRDEARERAPNSVLTLGRIVSLTDFADFARNYAGIDKARAERFQLGEISLVHLTVAGEDGAAIEPGSRLESNLQSAMNAARTPHQRVRIASYRPLLFNVAARLLIDENHGRGAVLSRAEAKLRAHFDFRRRAFGRMVTSSETIAVLRGVEGVLAVDLDQLFRDDGALGRLELAYENRLEKKGIIDPELRSALNAAIPGPALSAAAIVGEELPGRRWSVFEPGASVGLAVVKAGETLNVYAFAKVAAPRLPARTAEVREGIVYPAELLLLNPDRAGVALMEFSHHD